MGPTATVAPITSVSPENHQITMEQPSKIDVSGVNFYYGAHRVLHDISLRIAPNQVTAFIGPSGCGKSTFRRSMNRINDIIPGARL